MDGGSERHDTLLNEKQAARILGASPRTLESWRTSKKGPPYMKLNGLVRYRESAIEQFIAEHTVLS